VAAWGRGGKSRFAFSYGVRRRNDELMRAISRKGKKKVRMKSINGEMRGVTFFAEKGGNPISEKS